MAPVPQVNAEELRGGEKNWDDLDDHEKLWLRDHGLTNAAQEREISNLGVTFGRGNPENRVSNDPNFIAEQQLAQSGYFDKMVEERAKELATQMLLADQQGRGNVLEGETTGRVGNAPVQVTGGSNPEPVGGRGNEGETEEAPPYDQWSNTDLKNELKARDLHTTGSKEELVARLEADDEESEGSGGS